MAVLALAQANVGRNNLRNGRILLVLIRCPKVRSNRLKFINIANRRTDHVRTDGTAVQDAGAGCRMQMQVCVWM